jgi:hypothetical protein
MAAIRAAAAAIHQADRPPESCDAARVAGVDAVRGAAVGVADRAVVRIGVAVVGVEVRGSDLLVVGFDVTGETGRVLDLATDVFGAGTLGVMAKCELACRRCDALSFCSA